MYEIFDYIESAVNQIWDKYDVDGTGWLNDKQTMELINETLVAMKDSRQLTEKEFMGDGPDDKGIFGTFDLDGNNKITKKEMTGFILSLTGFC